MSLKTAQEHFAKAQQDAESVHDSIMQELAAGLHELCRSLKIEINSITSKIAEVESKVRQIR